YGLTPLLSSCQPSSSEDSLFFFFQAEDGIRDGHVTGVQTCALPILFQPRASAGWLARQDRSARDASPRKRRNRARDGAGRRPGRSEERRVGKECRAWGSPYH